MSLYNESGYDTPKTKITMTARLSVNSHKKGLLGSEGNTAATTCGIVSPMIIQNASMPPNALQDLSMLSNARRDSDLQSPLCDRDSYETRSAKTVFHRCLEGSRSTELGIDDKEIDRPVHG